MERKYSQLYQDQKAVDRYEKFIYKRGGPDDILWNVEQKVLYRLLRKHSPGHENASALDFACGSGRILSFLEQHVAVVTGVDISPAMLDKARRKVENVRLVCADIVSAPEDVPGEQDIITSFRFLLLAEPSLREACIKALTGKLRGDDSVMILGIHGNPRSRRALATLRDKLFTRGRPPLPAFSLRDMYRLADVCGLRVVDAGGLGFLPRIVCQWLPARVSGWIERVLADRPFFWRFGSNLVVVCKRVPAER